MANEKYACPMRDKCSLYNNENPTFSGVKSPFRGVDLAGEEPGSRKQNILDFHYRLVACEGAIGVPCYEVCGHYELIEKIKETKREHHDLGLSEAFPGSGGIDLSDDLSDGEEIVDLEGRGF